MSEPALQLDTDQSPQVVGDAIGLDKPKARGCLEVGERFGELVALKIHAADRRGHIWLCECDCGRLALRHAADLRRSVREGHCPMCAQCLRELRRGLRVAKNETAARRRSFIARAFAETGSLYAHGWEAAELIELRRELGLRDPPPAEPVRDTETLGAYDGPQERNAMTLDEVAEEFGITRERVRQIECKALRKLRHPSRAKLLAPFLDGAADKFNRAEHERKLLNAKRAATTAAAQEKIRLAREKAVAILRNAGKWQEAPEPTPVEILEFRMQGKVSERVEFAIRIERANNARLREIVEKSRALSYAQQVDEALQRIEQIEKRLQAAARRQKYGRAPRGAEVDSLVTRGELAFRDLQQTVNEWPEDGPGRKK